MTFRMNDLPRQQQLISALLDPHGSPLGPHRIHLIETHISWVLLAGRFAYKIKKAVDLKFLDFTTLESRKFYCDEEIRLNRRLARQIYLDVLPIGGSPEHPMLDQQPAIEYAVRMRRFASAKLMDKLLDRGLVTPQHMDNLAATLARFHASLPPAPPGSAHGTAASIRAAAMQNFGQLHPLLPGEEDRKESSHVGQLTETEYAACESTFNERHAQGFVRECHGDLHLGNIALIGGEPVPFDGIEFNADLRWLDVMNEAAFPVMDLLQHGQPGLAFRFLNAYLEATGDYAGIATLRFYLAYHAMVRAKVEAIRASQPGVSGRARTRDFNACRRYLALARQCLAQRHPALIITHGLPGSGKTTLAQMALERLGAIRIRSDVERKRLFGLAPLADSRGHADIYSMNATRRTYARLHELARIVIAAGFPVIVDAAFLKRGERERFRQLAQEMNAPFAIAATSAPDATLRARIAARHAGARDASEADESVLNLLQTVEEPIAEDEKNWRVEFSSNGGQKFGKAQDWARLDALIARHD
jgi:aminoglycoside phosphotransferase family enzyme/predicted kinase